MEKYKLSDGTLDAYRAAYKDSENIYTICAKVCGLSDAEYWTLLMFHEGCKTQSDISEQLFVSKQTVNSACKQLVQKGLIRLETLENNLRTKHIFLTDAGVQFVEKYIHSIFQAEERVWASLSEDERITLITLTRKYNELMKLQLHQYQEAEAYLLSKNRRN